MTNSLNGGKVGTSFSEGSCATSSYRVAGKLWGKEGSKPGHKPVSSGYGTPRCEPEFRIQGEKSITRGQIRQKTAVRVGDRRNFLDHDCVPFKGAISFVGGRKKENWLLNN